MLPFRMPPGFPVLNLGRPETMARERATAAVHADSATTLTEVSMMVGPMEALTVT